MNHWNFSEVRKFKAEKYLTSALTRAEKAHVEYERQSGTAPKVTWPEFYAHFIVDDLPKAGLQIDEVSR